MKELFASIGGNRIRYLEASVDGDELPISASYWTHRAKTRQRVLFIHGLGSSADRWLDIPDAMSLLGFHAIAIDLPGFGASDKPADMKYTIANFVQVITKFMREKGLDGGRTSIIGHSLGGYIAAQLAIDHRYLVDKLVLIDSSGMLQGPTPLLQEYLTAAMKPSKELVRRVFEQLAANPSRIPEILVDGFIHRIKQPNAQLAFRSAYEDSTSTQIGIDRLDKIGDIQTLIMWGSQDSLIPIEHARIFAEGIRDSRTVIVKDAGHAPFAEKPAIVCEILHSFLGEKRAANANEP